MTRSDENRFSVSILEKDVMEYHSYKVKYNHYYEKHRLISKGCEVHQIPIREKYKQERDKWYGKYISKMRYLEKNYRKSNIYTRYHEQLEQGYSVNAPPEIPMAIAKPISPSRPAYEIVRPVSLSAPEMIHN